jgi:transcription-repair coupling factor (superfamily II helicase)
LAPGDYVVHVTHGIGRFMGIRTLEAGGQRRDYLHIAYAGDDSLYVPVEQLDLVQRYQGPDDRPPKLSRLGGAEWSRAKERVKASVRELAEGLIKLYAARQARPGFAFGPDTPWQRDFEAAFPYEETPDQIRATEEIKRDMEAPRPMDRLLLGDVGYGKTEVALRAAFKAIMAGKQVAMLVPTTLLAEQHYATARARMAGFPIEVEVLSRFRSPADQRAVIEGLKDGRVDFVIGTHRLLGKDVAFRDLGLLIVDEEHRFGVAHKERIKQLKETVDVLTLSATPIPRTLHMTMIGIRDVSVIETPPEDRFPVETIVAEYDEDLVREAIRRELDRDGQVYYVQNRIAAMDGTLARLRRLLPDARIAVAHGRMDEDRLEDVMARFLAQEYDILLATSIIESGLDIPNVNTLIVEDADRLGLAQLYQLRGRVGRSSRLAYAYFTYRPDRTMTPEAEQRLAAIRDFTELGSGYQLALRDLEIRGAGNLLGPEQHGFVAAVGFELYTALLAEAVAELKGEAAPEPVETALEFDVNAYLPDDYVDDHRQKIALYKRLVGAKDLATVEDLSREMAERYGPPPEPVLHLLRLARMRVMARQLGLAQVTHRGDRLVFRLARPGGVGPEAVVALGRKYPGRLIQMTGKAPELGLRLSSRSARDVLETALDALETMRGAS